MVALFLFALMFTILAGRSEGAQDRCSSLGECSISIFPTSDCREITAKEPKGNSWYQRGPGVMFKDFWHTSKTKNELFFLFSLMIAATMFAISMNGWYIFLFPALYVVKKLAFTYYYSYKFISPQYRKPLLKSF